MLSRSLPTPRPGRLPLGGRLALGAIPLLAAALVVALAFAVTQASAAGDQYGDSTTVDGFVDGDASDATGADDGAIVQIGAADGGGSVTVSFDDNVAFDGPGDDIRVHTLDALAPATATIEVSADGVSFVSAGDFPDTAAVDIDLGALGLDFASAVRVTHVSGELPGFDLDAVEALNSFDPAGVAIALAPATGQNLAGDDHTVTATATIDGAAFEGVPLSFLVTSGPNSGDSSAAASDASGNAAFTYTGDGGAGSDSISAWLDLNGDGVVDTGEPQAGAAKDWLALGDLGLTLTPDAGTNPVDTQHTVSATLSPAFDGVNVRFRVVTGPNSGDEQTVATSGGGSAAFSYSGDGAPGVDAITAWLDVDGDGDIDAGEPQDTVTKTWTAVTTTAITLSPVSDTNPVGAGHTVTATLSPSRTGAQVRFSVNSGPNAGQTHVVDSDTSSQATFTYVGAVAGTDLIEAYVDENRNGIRETGEAQAFAVKTWTATDTTAITLSPAIDTNPIGSNHTVTATLSPAQAGAVVQFEVTAGPNVGRTGVDVTNTSGQASFTYSSALPGSDVVVAWFDANSNGLREASELASAVKTWTPSGTATAIALAPVTDTNFVGSSHTLTATVTPPASGVLVRFEVIAGPHTGASGVAVTGAAGTASFSYTGATAGSDVIRAWVDLDGDGLAGAGEPQAIATKSWVTQPGLDGDQVDGDAVAKVTICHVPPGNPGNAHTISVGAPATAAHLAHGDSLGACSAAIASQQDSVKAKAANAAGSTKLALRIRATCEGALGSGLTMGALQSALNGLDLSAIEALLASGDCTRIRIELDAKTVKGGPKGA